MFIILRKFAEKGVHVPHFDLRTLLPPVTKEYYRYEGSLTTPPCAETVVWTVFKHPQTISEAQVQSLNWSPWRPTSVWRLHGDQHLSGLSSVL